MALNQSEEVTQKKHSCLSVKTLSGIGADFENFCSQVAAASTWWLQTERGRRARPQRAGDSQRHACRTHIQKREQMILASGEL